jgi:hypothetical protein
VLNRTGLGHPHISSHITYISFSFQLRSSFFVPCGESQTCSCSLESRLFLSANLPHSRFRDRNPSSLGDRALSHLVNCALALDGYVLVFCGRDSGLDVSGRIVRGDCNLILHSFLSCLFQLFIVGWMGRVVGVVEATAAACAYVFEAFIDVCSSRRVDSIVWSRSATIFWLSVSFSAFVSFSSFVSVDKCV